MGKEYLVEGVQLNCGEYVLVDLIVLNEYCLNMKD